MILISEKAMRRIFPGWIAAYPGYENLVWHQIFGPDDEGYYRMPQGGTNIHDSRVLPEDLIVIPGRR